MDVDFVASAATTLEDAGDLLTVELESGQFYCQICRDRANDHNEGNLEPDDGGFEALLCNEGEQGRKE